MRLWEVGVAAAGVGSAACAASSGRARVEQCGERLGEPHSALECGIVHVVASGSDDSLTDSIPLD